MRNRNGTRLRRMHELMVAAASSLKLPAIRLQKLDQLATLHRVYYTHHANWHRSKNAAFDALSCTTVPVSREGGPAKWLKNKNLSNHHRDYEPGGREFESLRARHQIN
jgi:hypothetical protein